MGFYDRDYYREDAPPQRLLGGHGQSCKRIIAVTVAVYIAQLVTGDLVGSWLAVSPEKVFSGQIWRVLTYALCHDVSSPLHIIFNMLLLWWFGNELEGMYGSGEFLKFYIAGAVVSGVAFCVIQPLIGQFAPAMGASGAVMAVMALYTMHFPRRVIYIFFIIPVELWLLLVFYVAYDLYPLLRTIGGHPQADHIAHTAHLGGLVFGLLYKHYNLRIENLFSIAGWETMRRSFRRKFQSPRDVKIYRPDDPEEVSPSRESVEEDYATAEMDRQDLNQRVDEILAKISAHGEASLTVQERDTLKEASRRFKHR